MCTDFHIILKFLLKKNCNAMELAGAQRCFQYLQEKGIKVSTFISDRHKGIAKWIRETTDTKHYHDILHIVKGLTKKLTKAGKETK